MSTVTSYNLVALIFLLALPTGAWVVAKVVDDQIERDAQADALTQKKSGESCHRP